MWPAGASSKLPCPRDSALRRAAFSGNLAALPSHLVPAGRSVRVFISANPEGESLDPSSRVPGVRPSFSLRSALREPASVQRRGCARACRGCLGAWGVHASHFSFLSSPLCLLTSPRSPVSLSSGRANKRVRCQQTFLEAFRPHCHSHPLSLPVLFGIHQERLLLALTVWGAPK